MNIFGFTERAAFAWDLFFQGYVFSDHFDFLRLILLLISEILASRTLDFNVFFEYSHTLNSFFNTSPNN
jgi:hypothetical protein